jgi:hypothetical protein
MKRRQSIYPSREGGCDGCNQRGGHIAKQDDAVLQNAHNTLRLQPVKRLLNRRQRQLCRQPTRLENALGRRRLQRSYLVRCFPEKETDSAYIRSRIVNEQRQQSEWYRPQPPRTVGRNHMRKVRRGVELRIQSESRHARAFNIPSSTF